MNYTGHEDLRAAVAALTNSMCDLRDTLNGLERQYRYDAPALTNRLAGQTLRRINTLYLAAYQEALELDESFKD